MIKQKRVKSTLSTLFCISFLLGMVYVARADAVSRYTIAVKSESRGEYNITVRDAYSKPELYKKVAGSLKRVSVTYKKSSSTYRLFVSLEANKTYYVKVSGSKKPTVTIKANYDKYSSATSKRSKGIMWTPKDGTYQPYDLQFIYTKQITYLTRDEAIVYSMNLDKSKYLKLLDTGIKLTVFIATMGWSQTALGEIMAKVGKNKLVAVAKLIAKEYGGIKFVPSMKSTVKKAVQEATNGYTTGLKIVTKYSDRGGLTNCYESWNEKNSSVKGKKYCRGTFSEKVLLKGWY